MNNEQTTNTNLAELVQQGAVVMRIENETQQQVAVQRPRNFVEVLKNALQELEASPNYASRSYYVIPYKDHSTGVERIVNVEGLSIRGAEALARLWGNCSKGARIISETPDSVIVQGVFIDYESNFRAMKELKISRFRYDKKTKSTIPLRDDRLTMAILAGLSKVERNAILSGLPVALKDQFFQSAKLLASRNVKTTGSGAPASLSKRIDAMLEKFQREFGVSEIEILKFLDLPEKKKITEDNIGLMIGVFNALEQGERTVTDVFGDSPAETPSQQTQAHSQVNAVLSAPPPIPPPVPAQTQTRVKQGGTEPRKKLYENMRANILSNPDALRESGDLQYQQDIQQAQQRGQLSIEHAQELRELLETIMEGRLPL